MNAKKIRRLLSLASAVSRSAPVSVTVYRAGGLLRMSVPRVSSTVRLWAPDDGEDFEPRTFAVDRMRRMVAGLDNPAIGGTSKGLRFTEDTFTGDLAFTDHGGAAEALPEGGVTLSPADLATMRWVALSVAPDDNRYGLAGYSVEPDGLVIATDGNRLHRAPCPGWAGLAIPPKMLVPRDWFATLVKLGGYASPVRVAIEGQNVYGIGDGWAIRARLLTADFPEWRHVIPPAWKHAITVDAGALRAKVRRVAAIDNRSTPTATLTCESGALSIRVRSSEGDSVAEQVPAVGELPRLGINIPLFLDVFSGAEGEVSIKLAAGPLSPIEIRPNAERIAIVMPVRLD